MNMFDVLHLHRYILQQMHEESSRRSQWLMTETQLSQFRTHKQHVYKEHGACTNEPFNDDLLSRQYLKNFLIFLRKRKIDYTAPFKYQKIIYLAVLLFKRYYLLNSFMHEEPTQSFICAINVAMKMNEYAEGEMHKHAKSWSKKEQFQPNLKHKHYGDDGYSEIEIRFMNGIGFQTAYSKLIQPLQSLYSTFQQEAALRNSIYSLLNCIYLDQNILFEKEGPKLALAIMLIALKNCRISAQLLPQNIKELIEKNQKEILSLMEEIESIVSQEKQKKVSIEEIRSLKRKTKGAVFKKPELRRKESPHFHYKQHQPFQPQ